MAPAKAFLIQRITAPDFMNIRWNRISGRTPFMNAYPYQYTGTATIILSNPVLGSFTSRFWLSRLRRTTLFAATGLVPLLLWAGAMEWYDWYRLMLAAGVIEQIPEDVQHKRLEELKVRATNTPGVRLPYYCAGQVSIPGSDINIK